MSDPNETIYALATPPGKSGVAVVRLSGVQALQIAQAIAGEITKPRHAYFRKLLAADGRVIDEALVLYFQAPASFTGEDVIEFQIHGGRAVISALLARIAEFPEARMAEAGEFTRRALENGKLDMLQVEALGDFIDAETELQRQLSYRNMRGEAGEWVSALRDRLVEAMALVTAAIDFSDEELPADLMASIGTSIGEVKAALSAQAAKFARSQSLRSGYRVAIIGKPNVGKSSLINSLTGRDIAIASEFAGTTRDVLEVFLDIRGLPVLIYDTAGMRDTSDAIEAMGVERAKRTAEDADLRIFLYENSNEINDLDVKLADDDLRVQSKSDLYDGALAGDDLAVSAHSGAGIDALLSRIHDHFAGAKREFSFFANERQRQAVQAALDALDDAESFYAQGEMMYEWLAESLRQAVFALDVLVGDVDVEDLLDVIFSKFCIGK